MSNENLTDWFPADVKPVHVGIYWTKDSDGAEWFSPWQGTHWGFGVSLFGIDQGAWPSNQSGMSPCQHRPWRGLAEKPA